MNKNIFGKIISLFTAAIMTASTVPVTAFSEANSGETIIATTEDFYKFAESCVLDSRSRGKKYILECDVALISDFKPIPIFCGTFEGNGHTVSGLNITESGSDMGLFRYIEKEGTVKNLNVRGKTAPLGSASECGGVAGVNRGKILGCSFSGMVSGKERCGGIAGVNEETGLITGCKTSGLVQARHYTGGIAGENYGIIINCENESSVNVMAFDESMDLENINIDDIYSTENASEITDEGGIAGYSSGTVQNCVNKGSVGYIHVGYNVGGIAGRHEGYISGCENYGIINGRKDTGGIVGQAEPHISLLFSERSINKLRTQLEELNVLIDKTINNADANSSEMSANWDEICGELENARQISNEFLDRADVLINSDIDSVNELSSRISDFIDMAAPAADSLKEASDLMSAAFDDLSNSAQLISDSLETADEGMNILFPVLQDLSDAIDSFAQASASLDSSFGELEYSMGDEYSMELALTNIGISIEKISDASENIASSAAELFKAINEFANDPSLENEKKAIEENLKKLSEASQRFSERIKSSWLSWNHGGGIDESTIGMYLQEIADILSDQSVADIFESLSGITEHISNIMSSTAAKNLDEQLKAVSGDLGRELDTIGSAGDLMSSSIGEMNGQINTEGLLGFIRYLREANQDLNGASVPANSIISRITESWDYFDEASSQLIAAVWIAADSAENAKASAEQIEEAFSQTVNILDYFADKDKIEFVGADDDLIAARNRLSDVLEKLVELGKVFGDNTSLTTSTAAENFRQINSKTSEISDTILDLIDEISETSTDISDYTDDISAKDSAGRSNGKIERCENYGEINGDLCAGGIAGSMAIEYDFDPEGDIETIGSRSTNFMYQSKTVIRDSSNYGNITSKKGRAGGIAGEMSTGCLINCNGFGNIISTDGDCTGGIAGKSDAAIHGCNSKCRITGKNFVGGIAGIAHDMKNCRSFVVIEEGTERVGAVAGYTDFEGEISENVFIADLNSNIGAIDGISYSGIAYPVSYEQMISEDNISEKFKSLELVFISDGEIVKVLSAAYGEKLPEKEIPEVPQMEGCFGKWEEFNFDRVTFSAEINAVYTKYVTALESSEKRENGLPVFVAEGSFRDSDIITVASKEYSESSETWSITLPTDGSASHKVRFLPNIKPSRALITITENGVQRTAETEIDGKYLVTEIYGDNAVITVSLKSGAPIIILAASSAAIAAIIILIIIIRKNKKKRQNLSIKKDNEKSRV